MHPSKRGTIMALAGIMMFFLCLAAGKVHAQPFPWDPPCTLTKVINLSPCNANLTVNTGAGAVGPFFIASGASLFIPMGAPPVIVTGITTQAGAFVAATSPGAPVPGTAFPSAGSVLNVTLGPAPGCCFDIYFDNSAGPGCWIWLYPSAAPPPCIP